MPSTYPTSNDVFPSFTSLSFRTAPSHAGLHTSENNAVVATETFAGIFGSVVTSTLFYKVNSATSPGHKHSTAAVTAGEFPAAQLGSGAASNKYLRGDQVFTAITPAMMASGGSSSTYYRGDGTFAAYPASPVAFKSGIQTFTNSGTPPFSVNIVHSLGRIPSYIKLEMYMIDANGRPAISVGTSPGTVGSSVWLAQVLTNSNSSGGANYTASPIILGPGQSFAAEYMPYDGSVVLEQWNLQGIVSSNTSFITLTQANSVSTPGSVNIIWTVFG